MNNAENSATESRAKFQFQVAWIFLLVTAFSGVFLRWQGWFPIAGLDYGNVLHAHSHIAFLGWVFNAFFALSFLLWVPQNKQKLMLRLFIFLQVANVGMLLSFPIQGYGFASITFTTLHMFGSFVFAIQLWQSPNVSTAALPWLRIALVLMLASGLGPLLLGPLAAMDLRESAAYPLAIYGYLHFQYNGWFILFPVAVGIEFIKRKTGIVVAAKSARIFLTAGIVITVLISCLWLKPPMFVYGLSITGGLLQIFGAGLLLHAFWQPLFHFATSASVSKITRGLIILALGMFFIKSLMQLAACNPQWDAFVNHRYTAIAFMHAIFLGIVLPAVMAPAWQHGWFCNNLEIPARKGLSRFHLGLGLIIFAILFSEILLIYPVFAPLLNYPVLTQLPALLFIAAFLKASGLLLFTPERVLQIPSAVRR